MNLFPTIKLTKLGRLGLSFNQTELKIKVIEAVDTLKEALTRVNEMVELLLKVKEPIDWSQLIHMIFFFRL
jgi:hypothetical protein